MRQIWLWARLALGLIGGVVVLVGTIGAAVDQRVGRSALEVLTLGLGGTAFAVLAVGWGLRGRYPGVGALVVSAGTTLFGFAMLGFIVMSFALPSWLEWLVMGAFSAIGGLFVLQLVRGGRTDGSPQFVDGRLVVRSARTRTLLVAGLGLILCAASWWVLRVGGVIGFLIGGLGLALFGIATVWAVVLSLRPTTLLVADSDGLTDTSGPAAWGRIAWSEVARLDLVVLHQQCQLAITPHDPARLTRPQSRRRSISRRLNRSLLGSDVLLIGLSGTTVDPVRVHAALEELRGANGSGSDEAPQ